MFIKNVKIENFKRFGKLNVNLQAFDCLVGPNNGGKTTLLQALALFDFCLHHCLSKKNGTIELKERSISPEEFYVLPVASPVDLWTDRQTSANRKQKAVLIEVTFDNDITVTSKVRLNYNRFSLAVHSSETSQEWFRVLTNFSLSYLPVFSMFLPQEERRTNRALEEELIRGRVTSVIRNLLLELKDKGHQSELVEILQRTFISLKNLSIEFDEANDRYISVTYQEEGRPKRFDIFSAGSGFQQFVYLFGFILLRQPSVILLDEPDVHLHGSLQQLLLNELDRLVTSGKQVLFATHSRELISRMSPEQILSLEGNQPRRLEVQFDVYDALDRLGSMDATQLPVIQAYRRVLVVEDRVDRDLLATFCSKCLGASVWQQVERRLAVCYSRGNPWKQEMARLRQQLQQVIGVSGKSLEMFVVSDRDYYPDLPQLSASLPPEHLTWHIWERTEIENYLLSLPAILRLVEPPELFQSHIEDEFERLLETSRDTAHDQLVAAYEEYKKRLKKDWGATTFSRLAREYLNQHWAKERLGLVDAKEIVLPGIKRWLQEQGFKQFSDKSLAAEILPNELPAEIHELARQIAQFSGVKIGGQGSSGNYEYQEKEP